MPDCAIDNAFSCCSCNRTPQSVHWGQDNAVLYAASHSVVIVRMSSSESGHIVATKAAHTDTVNCVRWVKRENLSHPQQFLSGGVDKKLIVYTCTDNCEIEVNSIFTDASQPIVCLDGLYTVDGQLLIVASSGDSNVRVYKCQRSAEGSLIQSIRWADGFVLTLALILLPECQVPLLACGGDDAKIYLHVWENDQFEQKMAVIGHEDWIRGLEFTVQDTGDLLLASCAQDCSVRVWRLRNKMEDNSAVPDIISEQNLKLKEKFFTFSHTGQELGYSVIVETVLYGHEGWVYGVHWQPASRSVDGKHIQAMRLLTASMDKMMILWEPDAETGIWEEKLRVGEVGGNTLGLYGCQFSPDGSSILAHGYQGAFTLWNYNQTRQIWARGVMVGGHFGEVTDLAWEPRGEFLLTCSADQTTRLFAPWAAHTDSWYEMGRPQVHGYDMQCLCMLDRFSFASGAEEKIVRVFRAPSNFLENLQTLTGEDLAPMLQDPKQHLAYPEGASVPALGLSNKAVFHGQDPDLYDGRELLPSENEQYSESSFRPIHLSEPPSEDNLLQNTLWPETQKLYGHGYEIFSLAANPDGSLLVSACKATKSEHASLIVWNTTTWQQITALHAHSLTVVQMAFSHAGDRLLSVSRDRTWCIHTFDTSGNIKKEAWTDESTAEHSRIIWTCCWSHDDKYFVTGSRDKKMIFWTKELPSGGDVSRYRSCSHVLMSDSVTAVSMAPTHLTLLRYLVAAGLDSGEVVLCTWIQDGGAHIVQTLDRSIAHHLTVRRLSFRPARGRAGQKVKDDSFQLASCGSDHYVRVYNIRPERIM